MFERSKSPSFFFSKKERETIINKIKHAELKTSGEIRVHVTGKKPDDLYAYAIKLFEEMGMTATQKRNGVLIVLASKLNHFTIIGDEGINNVVPQNFWQDVVESVTPHFKQNFFAQGLCIGIEQIGNKLIQYFPYEKQDVDELSNEITYS
ncbi:TPM domain-containing protein [bacterium]|nr:TPM domain-containing protein [bacterium]